METTNELPVDESDNEDSGAPSALRKFKYSQIFSGENWIPARMGELIFRSELDSETVFLSATNDSNATMRLIKSYTHRQGIRATLRQCRVLFEDDGGNDVVRRGVVCRIEQSENAASYKQRMQVATVAAKRQGQIAQLHRLMTEVGLSPENYDYNLPFTDKDGNERHPQDFLLVGEDFPATEDGSATPQDIAGLIPAAKRSRGRPKRDESSSSDSAPRVKKTPNPFASADEEKRKPGRPRKVQTSD